MANGDYGDYTQQLAIAAKSSVGYQIEKPILDDIDDDDDDDTPVIKVDSLACEEPLLKKQESIDSKDVFNTPSEWSKFWTLVGRCQTHYYRDWVN